MYGIYKPGKLTEMAKALYREEREIKRLDGWFIAKETEMLADDKYADCTPEVKKAHLLCEVLKEMPLFLSDNAIFVGTQRDAFAKSYALINPSFTVEGFSGYCDPMAIYNDIEPNDEFTAERIDKVRTFTSKTKMVEMLNNTYGEAEDYTKEVIFFVEQVTGHVIPDFRYALKYGVDAMINAAKAKQGEFYEAAAIALGGVSYIDFEDPTEPKVEKLDWSFNDTTVFVVNCGGDHCNLTPNYAAIREEMESIAKEFGEEKLRFVNEDEFYMSIPELKKKFSGRAILRAMHYYEENARVEILREAIRNADEELTYEVISSSGISSYQKLQNVYPEGDPSEPIPLALALCGAQEGVMAYRVHGGGFAGTILAFVDNEYADDFHDYMGYTFGDKNVYRLKIRNEGGVRIDLGEND